MPSTLLNCPDETELLALALGEPLDPAIAEHVAECPSCQAMRDRLEAEVALVRHNHANACGPEAFAAAPDGAEGHGPLPDVIGRYKVVGLIDTGGEADVYRVVHIKLGNDLVLKLSRRRVDADHRSGLSEENRVLVDLQHPNLVRIYDLDFHEDRPFLVMEYVHGRNLQQYRSEEPVTPRRAAELVAKLADVMAVAHRHGITHCDIKPNNILIDKLGEPRLIDFGMARLRHAWSDRVESTLGGTVAYMAPEQARLEIDRIGPRSDIFALGGVLYFLLTGHAPFVGQTDDEVWDRACRCDYDAGALRAAKVPRRLQRICLKAMAADPADRYAPAEALAKALKSHLRRRALIAALALVVLVPAVALGARSLWPTPTPPPTPPVVIHHPPALAPTALTGELQVRVWSKDNGVKHGLEVGEPGALPLLPGEQVHLEAHINQPAYPYLLWLDGQGHVSLLYPRQDHKFGGSPFDGSARETVHSPEARDEGLRMKGPGGLETALLLVRRTPLSPSIDLAASIGPLPPSPLRSQLEVAKRGFDESQPVETLRVDLHRAIDEETEKIDDPLLQLMERLRTQNRFDVIKAVRFAYRGE
jgi:serine/threonine protein kinase